MNLNLPLILISSLIWLFSPLKIHAKLSADVTGGYSWGNYDSPGQSQDAHAGAGIDLFGGYRAQTSIGGIEAGAIGTFAFPEISVLNSTEDASFSFLAVGAQAGYLWREKIQPFVQYLPYARLSQTKETLSYTGRSYGGGAKVYLTNRENGAVQMGLRFQYLRESYSQAKYSVNVSRSGVTLVTGDSYQMGLFIGI